MLFHSEVSERDPGVKVIDLSIRFEPEETPADLPNKLAEASARLEASADSAGAASKRFVEISVP